MTLQNLCAKANSYNPTPTPSKKRLPNLSLPTNKKEEKKWQNIKWEYSANNSDDTSNSHALYLYVMHGSSSGVDIILESTNHLLIGQSLHALVWCICHMLFNNTIPPSAFSQPAFCCGLKNNKHIDTFTKISRPHFLIGSYACLIKRLLNDW